MPSLLKVYFAKYRFDFNLYFIKNIFCFDLYFRKNNYALQRETRQTLLQVLSQIVPYEVDISKLSRTIGIQRPTTLKYLKHLEEAALIRRLFTQLDTISDLQKPDKILLDNSNLLYTLSDTPPEIGTVRETFFCNQLHSAEHRVEYGGIKTGDFRIDRDLIVEVGGPDKSFKQVQGETNAFLAVDDIDSATARRIPLWAFGFLY